MERRVALSWLVILISSLLATVPLVAAGLPYGPFDWAAYEPVYHEPPPTMPDLVLSKSAGPSTVPAGSTITYTIEYRNAVTQTAATNVWLTDTLPIGVVFQLATPMPTSLVGNAVVWSLGTLGGGESGTIQLTGLVSPTIVSGTILHNVAAMTMDEADASPGNEVAYADTAVGAPGADRTPPLVKIISPWPDVVWFDDLRYPIKWRAVDLESGVPPTDSIRLRYSLDDGATWTTIVDSVQAMGKASCGPGDDCSGGVAALSGDDLLDNAGCAADEECTGRAEWARSIDPLLKFGVAGVIAYLEVHARDRGGNWGFDRAAFRIQELTPGAVRDVQVSNATDIAAALSFETELDSLAHVVYRERDTATAPGLTANDFRGSVPGQTHFFRLGGSSATDRLKPNTAYAFSIHLNDSIDPLDEGSFTTGPTLDLRPAQSAFGQVLDEWGNPMPGALVEARIEHRPDTISPTLVLTNPWSAPLATVTDESGYWWLDLASVRTPDLTAHFPYSPTDPVHLTARGGGGPLGSIAYGDPPANYSWPFDLHLRRQSSQTLMFGVGWNAVSLPLDPTRPISASQLGMIFNGDGEPRLTEVYRYTPTGWEGVIYTRTTVSEGTVYTRPMMLGANDFALQPTEGYFFKMTGPYSWDLPGFVISRPITIPLSTGWNLIGVPSVGVQDASLTAWDISDGFGMVTNTMTYNVAEVDRFIYGGFEGHVSGYPFNNFALADDEAYIVRVITSRGLIIKVSGDSPPEWDFLEADD